MANTKSIDFETSSSQYLSITDAAQTGLDITGDMTVAFWVNFESSDSSNFNAVISKYGSATTERSFMVDFPGLTSARLYFTDGGGTNRSCQKSFSFSLSTWYHLLITFTASTGIAGIFVDGTSIGSSSTGASSINNSTSPFQIGAITAFSRYADAKLDEVNIWDKVLNSTEIAEAYNSGDGKIYTGSEANLQGYWRFEDNLLDGTSNNNDLTNNNSATYSTDVPFAGTPPVTATDDACFFGCNF